MFLRDIYGQNLFIKILIKNSHHIVFFSFQKTFSIFLNSHHTNWHVTLILIFDLNTLKSFYTFHIPLLVWVILLAVINVEFWAHSFILPALTQIVLIDLRATPSTQVISTTSSSASKHLNASNITSILILFLVFLLTRGTTITCWVFSTHFYRISVRF